MYFIDDGPYFKCLDTLVDHYSRFTDGLPCKLLIPVPPETPLKDNVIDLVYLQVSALPKKF